MNDLHLNDSERGHYEDSIGSLQKASTLEKLLLWLITVIAAVGLAITIVNAQDNTHEAKVAAGRQQQLLEQFKATADAQNKASQQKLDKLQQHIDCIVALFQRPDRASLVLTDITKCQFNAPGSPGGATGATKSSITLPTIRPHQSTPSPIPPSPTPPTPPTQALLNALKLSVCLPLSSVCVER